MRHQSHPVSPAVRRARQSASRRQLISFLIAAGFGLVLLVFLLRQPPEQPVAGTIQEPAQTLVATPLPTRTQTPTPTATPTPEPSPSPTPTVTETPTPDPEPPEPSPTPEPLQIPPGHAAVDADVGLNVRSAAGFEGQVLRVLPDRTIVALTGTSQDDSAGTWYELAEEGGGWVLGTYLLFPPEEGGGAGDGPAE